MTSQYKYFNFFSVWLSFGNISRLSIRRIRITFFKWLLMLVSHFKAHATLSGLRVSLVSLGLPLRLFKQALWGGDKVSPEEELRKVEAKVRYNTSAANGDFTVIRSSLDCGSSQCKAPCGSWSLGVFCWLRKCMKLDDGLFSSDTPWRNRKCLSSEIEGLFPFHLSSKKSSKFCHQIMLFFFCEWSRLAWDGRGDAVWPWIIPQCDRAHRLSQRKPLCL